MKISGYAGLAALLLGVSPTALFAQDVPDEYEDEIVVTGQPERGAVIGNVTPEIQLRAADVRALGATTIAELLTELEPQTNAAAGSPVVLLNGKRISSFSEIQDLPTEAVSRVEILPEQVALSYGYSANQKVVNIVLRPRFRAELGEVRGGLTTESGRENGTASASLLRIRGDNRLTVDLKYSKAASLLESERDVVTAAGRRPYALGGNVTAPTRDGEIDPALSALAGQPVTVAAVPAGAATGAPALGDFVAGANTARVSDLSRYRTLSPETESFSANATLARALGDVSATVNGRVELSESDSLQGLPSFGLLLAADNPFSPFANDVQLYRYLDQTGALTQRVRSTTGHVGVTLNGGLVPGWQWSFTGNGDIAETRTRTQRGFSADGLQSALDAGDASLNPFGAIPDSLLGDRLLDRAKSRSQSIGGDLLVSGALFKLPAGNAMTTLRFGASANGFSSDSVRSGVPRSNDYSRETGSGQVSIDLPVSSRDRAVLGAIGDTSVNVNAAVQKLSDFGTLSTLGYGLRWTPVPKIRLQVSASQDRSAPSGQQISNPLVSTPNVSVFDYARGETVFVTELTGGNVLLRESVRDQFRVNATVKPFDKRNLTLTATYLNSRTRNPIAGFPSPTPAVEAAFPDRFVRDADGALVQIDARPINFLRSQSEELRWGFNFSVPLKSAMQKQFEAWRAAGSKPEDRPANLRGLFGQQPGGERQPGEQSGEGASRDGQATGEGPRGAGGASAGAGSRGGSRGPGGSAFGGGQGQGSGRLQFSLYHTWHLTESILIAPGVPALDLLSGDATGSSGGQPRHELQGRFGYSNNGLGARLNVNWESGTHVDGALGGVSRLDFGSLVTTDLRVFANLSQVPGVAANHPFLRGARVSLNIDNLFNTRRKVSDATGATPLRYQPGYLDPLGRTVTISFRKLFSAGPPTRR